MLLVRSGGGVGGDPLVAYELFTGVVPVLSVTNLTAYGETRSPSGRWPPVSGAVLRAVVSAQATHCGPRSRLTGGLYLCRNKICQWWRCVTWVARGRAVNQGGKEGIVLPVSSGVFTFCARRNRQCGTMDPWTAARVTRWQSVRGGADGADPSPPAPDDSRQRRLARLWSLPRWLTVFVLAVVAAYLAAIGCRGPASPPSTGTTWSCSASCWPARPSPSSWSRRAKEQQRHGQGRPGRLGVPGRHPAAPAVRADRPDLPARADAMAGQPRPAAPAGLQLRLDRPVLLRRVADLPRPVRPDRAGAAGGRSATNWCGPCW